MNSLQVRIGVETRPKYNIQAVESIEDVILIFLIGCVIGYMVETFFFFIRNGCVESRKGMVYGPFNQVYGFGAVVMTLVLIPLAEKGPVVLFAGSALLGGAFEGLCNCTQEKMFGTVGAFLLVNLLLSAMAVDRWVKRQKGVECAGWLDKRFPDERMAKIYPNMVMAGGAGAGKPLNESAG